jgi:hypothetical protein
MFLNKNNKMMDNIQKPNNYIIISSSHKFRYYLSLHENIKVMDLSDIISLTPQVLMLLFAAD